ncbi:hypothetical protein ACFLT1_02885 [Bacteroidota bacterium]
MQKKRIRSRLSPFLVVLLLALPGCFDDFPTSFPKEYTWEPVLAFPIGEADFGLKIPHGFDTLLLELDPLTGIPYWDLLEKIPLSGSIGFDFQEVLGKREEIDTATLRVNTYNGFPIEIIVQAYLIDEQGQVLDSLFNPKLVMERGELAAGGRTRTYAHTQREISFNSSRLDTLELVKKITFHGQLTKVSYFPEYSFRIQLGAILGIVSEL